MALKERWSEKCFVALATHTAARFSFCRSSTGRTHTSSTDHSDSKHSSRDSACTSIEPCCPTRPSATFAKWLLIPNPCSRPPLLTTP